MSTVKISELAGINLNSNTSNTILVGVDLPTLVTGKISATSLAQRLYLNNSLAVGNNSILFPNTIAQFTGNSQTYFQVNLQNFTGNGSSDFVATADNGINANGFINMGVNGSTFSDPDYSAMLPNDGYLYVHGPFDNQPIGNLVIGTATSNAIIKFIVGGTESQNIVGYISPTGIHSSSIDNAISSNIAVLQGVNLTQNTNILIAQGVDSTQNTRLGSIETINTDQNTAISIIQGVDLEQNTRLGSIETINTDQNTAISIIQGVDSTQNTRLGSIETINTDQNTSISIIQGVDSTQNTRLGSIETINTDQNTSISIIQGVDSTQNTRLGSIETINTDQNTAISIIQGVDLTQNTNITAADTKAQGAFNQANSVYLPSVTRLDVTNSGISAYLIDQYSGNNPTIYVNAGQTIAFNLNVTGHPFMIRVSSGGSNYDTGLTHVSTDGMVTTGSSAQGKVSGTLYWKVPFDLGNIAGNTYVYQCSSHAGMVGSIKIEQPYDGHIYTPIILQGAQTAFTINFSTTSLIKAELVSDCTISFSDYVYGKVVEVWLTNTSGNPRTITHGCSALNSTINSTTFSMPATSSAHLRYFSIGNDSSNIFVSVQSA